MATRIEVYPSKQGTWRWQRRDGDHTSDRSQAFDTRNEAFEDALVGRESEPIVLVRKDGTVHGELYHGSGNGRPPQRVDILAATSRDQAVNVDG